jgi:ribonuclease VapC
MVLDTSALVAVLLGEPERDAFIDAVVEAHDPIISAATLLEASIVMQAKIGDQGVADLDALLAALAVRPVAVDAAQAYLARDAYKEFGKGRSPAGLSYGDCFAYALAQATGRPLLFKGDDLARTDVMPVPALRRD